MCMANILISYFSDYGESMYDAISETLLKHGNNIFRININNKSFCITEWGGESRVSDFDIINKIKLFKPDLVLNFNNSLPLEIYSSLNKKCQICILDADNPETFWNKALLLKNKYKYKFLGFQSFSKNMYEKFLGIKLGSSKFLYFPPATIITNTKINQDKNISFIGSNFYPIYIPEKECFYSKTAFELYDKFKENYFFSYNEAKAMFPNEKDLDYIYFNVGTFFVGQERIKFLQTLEDLGLNIFGLRGNWNKMSYYDFDLAKCFDSSEKITSNDNSRVYNSSRISINISHPQAKTSFSWRVMDIMASNSCLLMEDKPDWRDLFEQYLSFETLNSVIYKDRFDMRTKAIKLLNNNTLRQQCVKELNWAIEKNGRWEHRFASLERFTNLKLLNIEKSGIYHFIERDQVIIKEKGCKKK